MERDWEGMARTRIDMDKADGLGNRLHNCANLEAGSKMPEVKAEILALEKILAQLYQQVDELNARLSAVLSPERPEAGGAIKAEQELLVPMAQSVRDLYNITRRISNNVSQLTQRIEV